MSNNAWDEITYTFPTLSACTVEVWELIDNFTLHIIMDRIAYNSMTYDDNYAFIYVRIYMIMASYWHVLTYLPLVPHICVIELGQRWFR